MTRRTKSLLALLPILGLIWFGYLLFRAAECRSVIAYESNLRARGPDGLDSHGIYCLWRIGTREPVEETPTLWQVICGARPVQLWLNNWSNQGWAEPRVTVERAQRMAKALRFFGSLEEISIQNAYDEGMALLMGVGQQPKLTNFYSFRVPITDDITRALAGFPRLEQLAINSSNFTGNGFPHLPHLELVDFAYSPISIEGLRAITASPKLTGINLLNDKLIQEHADEISAIRVTHPHIDGLNFDPPTSEVQSR